MEESNVAATVSLVAGVFVIFAHVGGCCLGFIPIVNMLGVFIGPLIWLGDLLAIGAGIMGFMGAEQAGVGKPQAIAGITIGALSILFQVVMIGLAIALFGLSAVLSILGG